MRLFSMNVLIMCKLVFQYFFITLLIKEYVKIMRNVVIFTIDKTDGCVRCTRVKRWCRDASCGGANQHLAPPGTPRHVSTTRIYVLPIFKFSVEKLFCVQCARVCRTAHRTARA